MNKLGIVVLNYGDPSDSFNLINTLIDFNYENLEICLVDNFSNSENLQKIKIFIDEINRSYIHFAENPNNDLYSIGNNIGLLKCFNELDCSHCLVLNPDIDLINLNIYEILNIDPKLNDLFTGKVYQNGKSSSIHIFNYFTTRSKSIKSERINFGYLPLYPSGCCWGMTKSIWENFGGFHNKKSAYYEELDYIFRFKKEFGVFPNIHMIDSLKLSHFEGGSTGASKSFFKKSEFVDYWTTRTRLRFCLDHNYLGVFSCIMISFLQLILNLFTLRFTNSGKIFQALIDESLGRY